MTVFEHRKGVEPQDPNQEAIDVQVCMGAGKSSEVTIGAGPWSIYDAENRRYKYASKTWEHPGAIPGYPVKAQIKRGDCIRGWVIIQGQMTAQMTKARYSSESTTVEWSLAP